MVKADGHCIRTVVVPLQKRFGIWRKREIRNSSAPENMFYNDKNNKNKYYAVLFPIW